MILTSIPDLLLQSKIRGLVSGSGRECSNEPSSKKLVEAASDHRSTVVILDLENPAHGDIVNVIVELVRVDAKVIGFYSHVHPEIAHSCLEAGCFGVLTRSQLDRQLPMMVEEAHAS